MSSLHFILALAQLSSPAVTWDGPALVAGVCEQAPAPAPPLKETLGAGPYALFGAGGSRRAAVEIGPDARGVVLPEAWIGKGRAAALEPWSPASPDWKEGDPQPAPECTVGTRPRPCPQGAPCAPGSEPVRAGACMTMKAAKLGWGIQVQGSREAKKIEWSFRLWRIGSRSMKASTSPLFPLGLPRADAVPEPRALVVDPNGDVRVVWTVRESSCCPELVAAFVTRTRRPAAEGEQSEMGRTWKGALQPSCKAAGGDSPPP